MYVINVICQSSACRETESGESLQRVTRVQRDIERTVSYTYVYTFTQHTRKRQDAQIQ